MRRIVSGFCCVVVGLQVLIGVPVAVCLAFFVCFGSDVLGPLSVEVRAARNAEPSPLPATIALPESSACGDPILSTRAERGSLLAGTVLGANLTPADEEREFVAAFRQVAEEDQELPAAPANPLPSPSAAEDVLVTKSDTLRLEADRFAVRNLYAIAEQDEQAGLFDRADQWRGHARAIRGGGCQPQAAAVSGDCAACLRFAE